MGKKIVKAQTATPPKTVQDKRAISEWVWSFSSLSSFARCPMSFRLNYLDEVPQAGNGFSDFGILTHEVLDQYAKGTITAEDCAAIYDMAFEEAVSAPYPPYPIGMRERAYHRGLSYFNSFTGFGEHYEIVGTEETIIGEVGGFRFKGIVDLVLRDKRDGRLVIIDHKTKSKASMNKDKAELRKQIYLYAHLVWQKYGEFPKQMGFNVIGEKWMLYDFELDEYTATIDWAVETINRIVAEVEFSGMYNDYFCKFICGSREDCPMLENVTLQKVLESQKRAEREE